jgi:hypothetical protein
MDPATILADVQLALSIGKVAMELAQDSAPFLTNAYNIAFGNKVLTDAERQQMRDDEARLRKAVDDVIAADDAAGDV